MMGSAAGEGGIRRTLRTAVARVRELENIRAFLTGNAVTLVLDLLFNSGADILLLDEPDNYLDIPTRGWLEEQIMASKSTILMVSHQLSAAAACDRILVLDGGRLVQQGHHNTLVHQSGTYRRLWEREQAEQQLSRAA